MTQKSPEFLWGVATSAHQIEGNNVHNDWWAWESQGNIEGGARSGPATDHWNRSAEDLKLAAELGINTYRFSVEWSRIEPQEGQWDSAAIEWYRNLLLECEKKNLIPMLTLHHFTSPQWFAAKGGFVSDKAVFYFSRFVEKVVVELGAHVPFWCTINEPMVLIAGTYLGKFMPPATFSPHLASKACAQLFRCHVEAYRKIHTKIPPRKGPWKDLPLQVGFAHNMLDFMPDRKWHPIEEILSRVFRRFYNDSWLDAVVGKKQRFGVLGLIPKPEIVREALGKRTVDFIGVNYYTKAYVRWRPRDANTDTSPHVPLGLAFARRKEPSSDLDWAIHPRGLYRVLKRAQKCEVPIYITENGIADRTDRLRPDYIRTHLEQVERARAKGMDIRGYYYWSLLDNFEWIKGFGPRFGLYTVNYETFERTKTRSAEIYREWIQSKPSQ